MWVHGILAKGPQTLYPPTNNQLNALVAFLLADPSCDATTCPLPIHGARDNRPRWDPFESMRFHIFRDRYERRIPTTTRPSRRIWYTFKNFPELEDDWTLFNMKLQGNAGEPVDEAARAAATAGLKLITPSSPIWPRPSKPKSNTVII